MKNKLRVFVLAICASAIVGALIAIPSAMATQQVIQMKECGYHWANWYAVVFPDDACPLPPEHTHGWRGWGNYRDESGPECITTRLFEAVSNPPD